MQAAQRTLRDRYAGICRQWQADGIIAPDANPRAVAQLMLSITLGFITQRSWPETPTSSPTSPPSQR